MTKRREGRRCEWCRRLLPVPAATGRPRRFCRQACRQRAFEHRQRADDLGLTEAELVVTRQSLDELYDHLYVLEAAIDDVDSDLAEDHSAKAVRQALDWLLDAARPLVALGRQR